MQATLVCGEKASHSARVWQRRDKMGFPVPLKDHTRLPQTPKKLPVKTLVPELVVETFDVTIFPW